jgi:anti-sigma-K factor RskA
MAAQRYRQPGLRDRLAAEYVLGTLNGPARRRLQALARYDPALRGAIADWEARLVPMADALPGRPPPARVWDRVRARIGARAEPGMRRPYARLALWRAVAIAATLCSIALAAWVGVATQSPPAPPIAAHGGRMLALLSDERAQPAMTVSWPTEAGADGQVEVVIRIIMPHPVLGPDQNWELWALPPAGRDAAPRSLGLIGIEREQRMKVDAALLQTLLEASGVALSVEPRGGSPTGRPTGPVMLRGPCVKV